MFKTDKMMVCYDKIIKAKESEYSTQYNVYEAEQTSL